MARASRRLISALRETAARLERNETVYRWSHFAHCNCGHLTQTITGLPPASIYVAARQHPGDWGEQARTIGILARPLGVPSPFQPPAVTAIATCDEGAWEPEDLGRCPVVDRTMSEIFGELSAWGLEAEDMGHLERLDDSAVRRRLGTNTIDFPHGDRQNVIRYISAWADLLEDRLGTENPEPERFRRFGDEEPLAAE